MTNCFPRLFVANEQKRSEPKSRLRTILWTMIFVLCMSFIPPFSQNIAVAQAEPEPESEQNNVPNGCKDDHGNPVEPINGVGAWAIILNFNHAPSATRTIACLAVVTSMEPEKTVEYNADFRCAIVENTNNVPVGRGKAAFDGNFKIECPKHIHETAPNVTYDKFYVHAKARFPVAAATYTLIDHSDVRVAVTYEPTVNSTEWKATIASRYGSSEFADSAIVEMIPDHRFGIQSSILGGQGTHHINGNAVATRRAVNEFGFDFDEPIRIGGDEPGWVLYNLIIDPPEPELN